MRVVVTGGRDFTDYTYVSNILRRCHEAHKITELAHGGAKGADSMAHNWAQWRNVPVTVYQADWENLKRAAGPTRNHKMLTEFKPDLVVAFPGGNGTADCVRQALSLGLRVLDLRERYHE